MNYATYLKDDRIRRFAAYGAIGALLAALAGEAWLAVTRLAPPTPGICLVLDTSGSMFGAKLSELSAAATEFVGEHAPPGCEFSVVCFDSTSRLAVPASADPAPAVAALSRLQASGSTNMEAGLQTAISALQGASGQRSILLFTDGIPDNFNGALEQASLARAAGIAIFAVATDDADREFLGQLSGNETQVFTADPGAFAAAFKSVGERLHDLVSTSGASDGVSIFRIGIWSALLAMGIGLALIAGQNLYLHRPALTRGEALAGAAGCAAAGAVAGSVGQLIYYGLAAPGGSTALAGRALGWSLMGGLLGLGIARIIPNLKPRHGALGGAVGGLVGGIGFAAVAKLLADAPGRWVGATLVGAAIGAMIAWIDRQLREAWLEVEYAPGEIRNVSLGREAVTVGATTGATVHVPSAEATWRYTLEEGAVCCEEVERGIRTEVRPDEPRRLGKATLRVRGRLANVAAPAREGATSDLGQRTAANPAASPSPSPPPPVASLAGTTGCLLAVGFEQWPLMAGRRFKGQDIPGLEPLGADGIVAEVTPHPQLAGVLGLKNHSRQTWQGTSPNGRALTVEPGRSVRVAAETALRFGLTHAKIIGG